MEIIAGMCDIAVVKIGAKGSYIKSGEEFHHVEACPADVRDATGAGDLYAAGFLYAHALGMPLDVCGKVGSITAGKVVEVIGPKIDMTFPAGKQRRKISGPLSRRISDYSSSIFLTGTPAFPAVPDSTVTTLRSL